MAAIVEFALLKQDWLVRTHSKLGADVPSLDWLPRKMHSSFDRA